MIGKMWHIGKNWKNVAYLGGTAKPRSFKLENSISST